ncbi:MULTISPECIES: DMT family transporter [unclassified Thioalkalivibrio]|uniref:DMT family transporter n=1 Tax=unclassified Thioalkalivibrio TaxID=2621013 RepID=UPI00037DA87D|nr:MULTISPECIES: DMT family transporter [unclassified Thioalkalivibrio]
MAFFLGLLTALGFGAGDFFGGLASRRIPALVVACYSQFLATGALLLIAVPFAGLPGPQALIWGGASGLALALGLLAYYRGLAEGSMGLVAAITGVISALVPLAVGLAVGERPGALALLGIAAIVVAIGMISGGARKASPRRLDQPVRGLIALARGAHPVKGLLDAVIAGVCFGLVFVFLDQAQTGSPLWPVVATSAVGAMTLALVMLILRPERGMSRSTFVLLALAGLFQAAATLAFVVAVRMGLLSIIAVAGALSPAPTALMARLFQAERMSRVQLAGFVFALLGIVLIVLAGPV